MYVCMYVCMHVYSIFIHLFVYMFDVYVYVRSCGPAQVPARDRRLECSLQAVHRGHTDATDITLC